MWHLKEIPKKAYFYWGNKTLPYLRYLSLLTFSIHNPDWQLYLYIPKNKYNGHILDNNRRQRACNYDNNYFDKINNIDNLDIIVEDFSFLNDQIAFDYTKYGSHVEVYKSDFLRWNLLSKYGGLWSDMDIIYFKSMDNLHVNVLSNAKTNTIITRNPVYNHSIGFLLSSVNNEYYTAIQQLSTQCFNHQDYQSIGVTLLNRHFSNEKTIVQNCPSCIIENIAHDTVYAYDCYNVDKIFQDDMSLYTKNSIGLHWYAGYHKSIDAYTNINHINYQKYNHVLSNTINMAINYV